jgi:hypothetical protein
MDGVTTEVSSAPADALVHYADIEEYALANRLCKWCLENGVRTRLNPIQREFCCRSHAKKSLAKHRPETFKRDELRTGLEVTCPGCGTTRYYSPADVPATGCCLKCWRSSNKSNVVRQIYVARHQVRVEGRQDVRKRQIADARDRGELRDGELLLADVAPKIGVSRPYLTSYIIRSGLLDAERRIIAGLEVWVVRNPELQRFRRTRIAGVDALGRTNHWHDREWVEREALDRGWVDARADRLGIPRSQALEQFLAEVDARRRHPAGRTPKEALREELRVILCELVARYTSLAAFSENEVLADIGEAAWLRDVDNFRRAYPADRFGDFDPRYRRNVIARVRGLIGANVKALQAPTKKS